MVERKGGRQRAQITGNVRLYRVCAELSKLGFNVNALGVPRRAAEIEKIRTAQGWSERVPDLSDLDLDETE